MVEKLSVENVELKEAQQEHIQSHQALMKANQELLEQLQIMKTQLATVKEDIRTEFDMKIDTIFDLFWGHPNSQQLTQSSKMLRENDSNGLYESPARKKPDNKGSPFIDRLMAMGDDRQRMDQLHAQNWLLHRFNGAVAYTPPMGPPLYHYPMQNDLMNLPQARADQGENVV